jgi:hypothetical protein
MRNPRVRDLITRNPDLRAAQDAVLGGLAVAAVLQRPRPGPLTRPRLRPIRRHRGRASRRANSTRAGPDNEPGDPAHIDDEPASGALASSSNRSSLAINKEGCHGF